ncbi:MAG: septum formation initiator family protein [Bacteroidetes bacterium]|nr:septum formation initiator family protein [Bacteroidota bacterium]
MKIPREKIITLFKNKYFVISFVFVIWVSFFDQNNLLFHHDLEEQKQELRDKTDHYKGEIEKNKKLLKNLNDSVYIDQFAREQFRMKKDDEDLFVIIEKQ